MIARMHKAMRDKDEGFTLIELLVVIIIIGILAAIAIPVFLNQRKKGVDASSKSDLRTVANEMETYFTDNQAYAAPVQTLQTVKIGATGDTVTVSNGDTITSVVGTNTTAYCLIATNGQSSHAWTYISNKGGLQAGTVACPLAGAF